ncbi:hypothetical protein WN71_009380 [Streptomyces mangrovisoli]|uniref:Condensation domain-containing protein n=1 Tax=Streptomyces mangrovisoli TaxID=1428628 RepID=A0A1J4P3G0_9ACTN|nr:hypothetical protein WN71_009380 [Streptomyces mangrovisoli]
MPGVVSCVVHRPGGLPGAPLVFELCGPLTAGEAESVAARIVERHRAFAVRLDSRAEGRHLLTLEPASRPAAPASVPGTGSASGPVPDAGLGLDPAVDRAAATAPGQVPGPVAGPSGSPGVSGELLADLLVVPPGAETVALRAGQRALVREAVEGRERGRHVEQLCWVWNGPLDTARFSAAWQSVVERESVLRASFDWVASPRLVLHRAAVVDVVRGAAPGGWADVVERDRVAGFDLHRAGLLRVTLLEEPTSPAPPTRAARPTGPRVPRGLGAPPPPPPPPPASPEPSSPSVPPPPPSPPPVVPPAPAGPRGPRGPRGAAGSVGSGAPWGSSGVTRVLLTYHRALLDERAVHVLLRQFYRAYLAGGLSPGGERRPDVRDHARWLEGRSAAAARAYWTAAAPPRDAVVGVGVPGGPTGQSGTAQVRRRLRAGQSRRLRAWAAEWGAGESSALHLVWALLLYRAAAQGAVRGAVRVSFGVYLPGRDIALAGAAEAPGLLGSALPVTVTVDPDAPVGTLVRQVRDAVLEMSAYPWVSGELIGRWSSPSDDDPGAPGAADAPGHGHGGPGQGPGPESARRHHEQDEGAPGIPAVESTVVFDSRPELPAALRGELTAQGIRVEVPHLAGGDTSAAVTLTARHDADGGLSLTAHYDRAVLRDADAARTISQCARVLSQLPDVTDRGASTGQVLRLLEGAGVAHAAPRRPAARRLSLATLRLGRPGADVICLVADGGVVPGTYDRFTDAHQGPERIVLLSCHTAPRRLPPALVQALGGGGRLLLCGAGSGASMAYGIARTVAAGCRPVVVMAGVGGAEQSAQALAEGLRTVLTDPA